MKISKLALKTGAIVLALAMGATVIWWRERVYRERNPWAYPENHARILAEARVHGEAVEVVDSNGNKYYFMGSSKYGWLLKPDDIDYFSLWRNNQSMPEEYRSRGSGYAGFRGNLGRGNYMMWDGGNVELELTVKDVPEGMTVEELMARDKKAPNHEE